jgi:pimeloyl-ACP methyl ester carboxylesterase
MTTVVMTHGAFCGGWTFERFRRPFEAEGWTVVTPDLPGHEAGGSVAGRSMSDYAEAIVQLSQALPEPPVLVGHSMGGLVCQMAARRVAPQALVLLAPSPPWGVAGSTVEEAMTALGVSLADPFWTGAVSPDPMIIRRHSLDRVPAPEREAILARMRPESGRAVREVLNWWLDPFMTTGVGAGPLPCPALVVAGETDQVHPVATARATAERIGAALEVMPKMSHWLIGEAGWEQVAERAIGWVRRAVREAA